jgi:hypothetical protein
LRMRAVTRARSSLEKRRRASMGSAISAPIR